MAASTVWLMWPPPMKNWIIRYVRPMVAVAMTMVAWHRRRSASPFTVSFDSARSENHEFPRSVARGVHNGGRHSEARPDPSAADRWWDGHNSKAVMP